MPSLFVRDSGGSMDMAYGIEDSFVQSEKDCIKFVRENPGCTAGEFNFALGADMANVITASRPLDTLKRKGVLRSGPNRICSVKGTKMMTWFFVGLNAKPAKKESQFALGYAAGLAANAEKLAELQAFQDKVLKTANVMANKYNP